MDDAEAVGDEGTVVGGQLGELVGKLAALGLVLGGLARVEADVLQEEDITVGEAVGALVGVLADDVAAVRERIAELIATQEDLARRIDAGEQVTKVSLLELRLGAAEAAVDAAGLEVRVAGGAGYAQSSPASRRFREAAFIPVQSPSETQLKWELQQARKQEG